MNFPQFYASIWNDPAFQELDPSTRLFFFAGLSQADLAGWWHPHPQLLPLQIPGLDLKKAKAQLSPWMQSHPSGMVSFCGYVAVQTGEKGLNLANGFHRGIHTRLLQHRAREVKAGADPGTIEGLDSAHAPSTGGVDPAFKSRTSPKAAPPEGQGSPTPGPLSSKSEAPGHELQVPSPTRGSGGAQCPTPPSAEDLDNVRRVAGLFSLDGLLGQGEVRECEAWEQDALIRASEGSSWAIVQRAATNASRGTGGPKADLRSFCRAPGRWVAGACNHPKELRNWTYTPIPEFKAFSHGPKERRWSCGVKGCRHHETDGKQMLPEHDHVWEPQKGTAWLVGPNGLPREVKSWDLCTLCGHQRDPELVEVAS